MSKKYSKGKYGGLRNPRVVAVVANDDYTLTLTFTNGEVKLYDMKPWLNKENPSDYLLQLKNKGYFSCARVNHGTVEWPNEQDICPDTLYEGSVSIEGFTEQQIYAQVESLS